MDKFALHNAAMYGALEKMRQLVKENVHVDSRDDNGRTPLHVAAYCGHYNVAQLLINSKCDINAVDRLGSTPLLTAAFSTRKDITDLLLRHGAQVNRVGPYGYSLLHIVSRNGWADTLQHILSLEEEVDVDAMTDGGLTPLMITTFAHTSGKGNCPESLLRAAGACAEILLRAGADPNRRGSGKRTALHWAVIYCSTRVVQVLLGVEGLDLNLQDVDGRTPLHLAWEEEHREILKEILEAGADYTIRDNDGETAFSEGIMLMKLNLEDIRLFVQKGLFLQEKEYVRIFQNLSLKESVLKDASLCTQSVVNKFHRQSLPALKSISYFAERLPNFDMFKLNAREIDEVEELVRCEIGRSNFCNVLKIHPMSLKALCILTLTTY